MRIKTFLFLLLSLVLSCSIEGVYQAQDILSEAYEENTSEADELLISDFTYESGDSNYTEEYNPETLPVESDDMDEFEDLLVEDNDSWAATDADIIDSAEDLDDEAVELEEAVTEGYEEFEESATEGLFEEYADDAEEFQGKKSNIKMVGDGGTSYQGISSSVYQNEIYASSTGNSIYYVDYEPSSDGYGRNDMYHIVRYDIGSGISTVLDTVTGVTNGVDFFFSDNKIYSLEEMSVISGDGSYCIVYCTDLLTGMSEEVLNVALENDGAGTVGVDDSGNIYIGTIFRDRLLKYSKDGELLAEGTDTDDVEDIISIDQSNGNIYYEGTCNWVYWGYNHYMASLKVARVNGNSIIFQDEGEYITIFYQYGFYSHYGCAELFDGRYLADLSTFSGDTLYLLDSDKISPDKVTAGSTEISLIDSGVSVSGVNLENTDAVLLAVSTRKSEYSDNVDTGSVGARCTYLSSDNSLLVATDTREITKYDISGKKSIGTIETSHPIYKLMTLNGAIAVLEKEDGMYYVETFSADYPEQIMISGSDSLKVGEETVYSCSFPSDLKPESTYSSSNPSVLSIDEDGNASAWKAGTAVVTVTTVDGRLSDSMEVNISGNDMTASAAYEINGSLTKNINAQSYNTYGNIVNSYLVEIDQATLMRVEADAEGSVFAEYMGWDGKVSTRKTIGKELGFFCGFYAGKDAYYVVFGQSNQSESDSTEVLRVVKYNTAWNRQGTCSISGVNTYIPVDAGSLRMDEYNDVLYIHTCHEMYQSSDGYHHQANMTFEINETDMTVKDSYSGVMNLSEGYVSHSFNQFIKADGGMIYRVDQGDAYPRGITITAYSASAGEMSNPSTRGVLYPFDDSSYSNYTGASIGGMEVTATHVVVAFNEDTSFGSGQRNIKIATCKRSDGSLTSYSVTNYSEGSGVTCFTPRLVKLSGGKLILIWVEYNEKAGTCSCHFAQLNGAGKIVETIDGGNYYLSDCQPILLSDGTIAWYVTDGEKAVLYRINPYDLEDIKTLGKTLTPLKTGLDPTDNSSGTDGGGISLDWDWDYDTDDEEQLGEDGTPFGKGASVYTMEDALTSRKSDKDPEGTKYAGLKLKSKSQGTNSIKLSWSRVKGASLYVIYGNKCGKNNTMKYLGYTSGTSINISTIAGKKISKGTFYKFFVAALDKNDNVCTSSKYIHVVSQGGKATNIKKLQPVKKKITLKRRKTVIRSFSWYQPTR